MVSDGFSVSSKLSANKVEIKMIDLPNEVKHIIKTLNASGYSAYAVGGCVRDVVMGETPKDWDICTSALPEQTILCFENRRTIPTGLVHGTVSLVLDEKNYEITTFRTDGAYRDNRRPDSVDFVSDLKSDLSRRDFTMNALAYHPSEGIIDYFEGQKDISQKLIRCVGEPDKRFGEDALRIMRAIRFCATLNFDIEKKTEDALFKNCKLLKNIAAERIATELNALILGENVKAVLDNHNKVLEVFIPEIAPMVGFEQKNSYHNLDVWSHTTKAVASAPPDKILRLTMLLHDIAKPKCYAETNEIGSFHGHPNLGAEMAKQILERLKYDNDTISTVTQLVLHHGADIQPTKRTVKRWLNKLGTERLRMLCQVKIADASAKANDRCRSQVEEVNAILSMIDEVVKNQECFTVKDLAIDGNDLIKLGISEGEQIGEILRELLEMVMDGEIANNREELLGKTK